MLASVGWILARHGWMLINSNWMPSEFWVHSDWMLARWWRNRDCQCWLNVNWMLTKFWCIAGCGVDKYWINTGCLPDNGSRMLPEHWQNVRRLLANVGLLSAYCCPTASASTSYGSQLLNKWNQRHAETQLKVVHGPENQFISKLLMNTMEMLWC